MCSSDLNLGFVPFYWTKYEPITHSGSNTPSISFCSPRSENTAEQARHGVLTILVTTFEEFSWIFPENSQNSKIFLLKMFSGFIPFYCHKYEPITHSGSNRPSISFCSPRSENTAEQAQNGVFEVGGGGWGKYATFSSITHSDMWVFKELEFSFLQNSRGVHTFLLDQV